jgi:biopolymer transport protein ExbD
MRYFEQRRPRIEIIPMIDIMLFLLVFFVMLTLKMIPTTGHTTKLPVSSTAEPLPVPKLLVEIADDGSVTADRQPMTMSQLTSRLVAMGNRTAVTLVGSQTVGLQKVMSVLDAIKSAGITQVSIAARRVD